MLLEKLLKYKNIDFQTTSLSTEIRLECPVCRQKGLKFADKKLYISTKLKVGQCKRCEWTGGWKRLLELLSITNINNLTPSLEELRNEFRRKRQLINDDIESILPKGIKPAWSNSRARKYLLKRGLNRSEIIRYGIMYCDRGFYEHRIILPVFDECGKYRTFVARYIGRSHESGIKKYLYPKYSKTSRLLYGLHSDKKSKRRRFTILVEGVFDAIHLAPLGLALFGTHISEKQINLLREAGIKRVVLCWDNDTKKRARENVKAALDRSKQALRKHFKVGIVWLPKRGTDPTEYSRKLLFKWAQAALRKDGIYKPI